MKYADREYKQISPTVGQWADQPRGALATFFDHKVVAVLAEPGMGKTTAFIHEANVEPNSKFVRIGEFLSTRDLSQFREKTLYLDGLDEHRGRINQLDVMDAITARLIELQTPKVRISCRTADWHDGKDVTALGRIAGEIDVVQLEMLPLEPAAWASVLTESTDEFIVGAKNNNLDVFLRNPQSFQLLHAFYRSVGAWPENKYEMMNGSCRALLKELNSAHASAIDDWVNDRDLEHASNYLAAAILLSNVTGVSISHLDSDTSFPCIQSLTGEIFVLRAATKRRVFSTSGKNRVVPKHRTIAEFMAAKYLADKVRSGLPISRVIALLTGFDGGVTSDLRGVFAWLTTMLAGQSNHLLKHDPYGAIVYGDAKSWTPETKRFALSCLEELATKDPGFREQDWSQTALGGLSDQALAGDFVRLLDEDDCNSHLLSVVLEAISYGPKLSELSNSLYAFATNPQKPGYLRSSAIEAFAHVTDQHEGKLLNLLNKINDEKIADKNEHVRGAILRLLFPKTIGPQNILNYIIQPTENFIGWYYMFIRSDVFVNLDENDLITLVNAVQNSEKGFGKGHSLIELDFIGVLLSKLFSSFSKTPKPDHVIGWLSLALDEYGSSRIDRKYIKDVARYLTKNADLYWDLFEDFARSHTEHPEHPYRVWDNFRSLTGWAEIPSDFTEHLLARSESKIPSQNRTFYFSIACHLILNNHPDSSNITIDDLYEKTISDQSLASIFSKLSFCEIEDWHYDAALRKQEQNERERVRKSNNQEHLKKNIGEITEGKELSALHHYSFVWLGLYADQNQSVSPIDRLKEEVGTEFLPLVQDGLINALKQPIFHSVRDIAKKDTEQKFFNLGYLMLAGLSALETMSANKITALSQDHLDSAFGYHLATSINSNANWPEKLIDKFPEAMAKNLEIFWRTQIESGSERLSNLFRYSTDDTLHLIIGDVAPRILFDFPKLHDVPLQDLIINMLRYSKKDEIARVVECATQQRFVKCSNKRAMWLTLGTILDPNRYRTKLRYHLRNNPHDLYWVHDILLAGVSYIEKFSDHHDHFSYRTLVLRLVSEFRVDEKISGSSHDDGGQHSIRDHEIRGLIYWFGNQPSEKSAASLHSMKNDPIFSHLQADINYCIANQLRSARETRFTYADISDVVDTLANGAPANAADLKALVHNALQEVAEEIRHGNTDAYKSFWNTDSFGNLTETHVNENTARDRVLDLLRPKLSHLDIIAEREASYAEDSRADIAIYSGSMKLPIEIKRDDHQKIWVAAAEQLETRYARDPKSEGNGIYLVIWFDGKKMKKPPKNFDRPKSAMHLLTTLNHIVTEISSGLIDVTVIDVSDPKKQKSNNALS